MNIGKNIMKVHSKNNPGKLKAFVDIDETICFYKNERIYEHAIPSYENIKKINKLYDNNWEITYYTARGSLSGEDYYKLTERQLNTWKCKYHYLSVGEKPLFDLIIDDRALRIEEL
tara:strand:- start:7408 stop:7755 length:348 start_codon:yes stop_codon:yes gene_type:complete